jgi:hypothetical protein
MLKPIGAATMKHLSLLFVLIATLAACNTSQPLIVSGSVGTYRYQTTPGKTDAKMGTTLVFKLRIGANRLTGNGIVSVTGPATWNNNAALRFTYPAGSDWVMSPEQDIAPVAGTYTVTVNAPQEPGSPSQTSSLTLTDPSSTLELSSITLSNITRSSLNATWTAVPGATGYIARLFNGTDNVFLSRPQYLTTTQAAFPETGTTFDLSPNKNNLVVLQTTNFDTVIDDPAMPDQVNVSDSATFIQQPQITSANLQTRGASKSRANLIVKP